MCNKLLYNLLGLSIFFGCDKGKELVNLNPETNMTIESINLSGGDRLNSLVEVKWWGTDPDGYIVGYESVSYTHLRAHET